MALNPRGRYMRCLRHVITTWIRRYPSPGRFDPRARAYSTTPSSLYPVDTVWCAIGPINAATGPSDSTGQLLVERKDV